MKKDNWILIVFLITFILSSIFGGITTLLSDINSILLLIILLVVIFIGIIFDMIGVAVLSSEEVGFHAMASKKIKGAKESITLLRNSVQVSSVCNDIVGDICGILSGALGTTLAIYIANNSIFDLALISILVASFISTLTVGGKALGKKIAVNNCDKIVFFIGKLKKKLKIK